MNKSTLVPLLLALLTGISSCSLSGLEGDVTAESHPPALHLHNQTSRTIYYFAGDESDLSLIDLNLSHYSDWPTVAPGRTAEIPYEDIAFYDEGDTRAWIYWTTKQGKNASLTVSLE